MDVIGRLSCGFPSADEIVGAQEGKEIKPGKQLHRFLDALHPPVLNTTCKSASCPLPQKGCSRLKKVINKGITLEKFTQRAAE